ncbi:protein O-mannosyl-transferase family [Acidobacteriota bacterium]
MRLTNTRKIALALFFLLLLVYAYTAAPEVTYHDSGEFITAAYTAGIAHPPGSPTFCLTGFLFSSLPVGSPVFRVHLMCGFFAALTCLFIYLLVVRLLENTRLENWWSHAAGLTSALFFAQSPAFWEKSVQAELYTLNTFFLVVILYLFSRWYELEAANDPRHRKILVYIALLFGIGAGNYLALLYYAPILAAAVIFRRPTLLKDFKLVLPAAGMFCLGLCVYLYLSIRSAANPPIDWGNPETLSNFIDVLLRKQWGSFTFSSKSWEMILHWLKSFTFTGQFGIPALLLALSGLFYAGRIRKGMTMVLLASFYFYGIIMMLMQVTTPALTRNMAYISRYGLQEFHLPLYLLVALFIGIGVYAVVDILHRRRLIRENKPAAKVVVSLLVITFLGWQAVPHFKENNYNNFFQPYEYGKKIVEQVPEGGFIFSDDDNSNSILTYLKFCKKERVDAFIIIPSRLFKEKLEKIAANGGNLLTGSEVVNLLRSNPTKYLNPVLNQGDIPTGNYPVVLFAQCPHLPNLSRHLYPEGIVFKLGPQAKNRYDKQKQLASWKGLLKEPAFVLTAAAKPDFRENMVSLLEGHAWWHFEMGEYDAATFLYLRAIEYSPGERADLLSFAASGMMEMGETGNAVKYCKKTLMVDQKNKRAMNILGMIFFKLGHYDRAMEWFRRIAEFYPGDKEVQYNISVTEKYIEARENKGN